MLDTLQLVLQYSEKYGGQYIGSFAEPPPASQETVSASIERLIVATTPWQQGIMNIRRIYRWESTKETSTYLAIFLFLWAVNLVSPAIVGRILPYKHVHTWAWTANDVSVPRNHRTSLTPST